MHAECGCHHVHCSRIKHWPTHPCADALTPQLAQVESQHTTYVDVFPGGRSTVLLDTPPQRERGVSHIIDVLMMGASSTRSVITVLQRKEFWYTGDIAWHIKCGIERAEWGYELLLRTWLM